MKEEQLKEQLQQSVIPTSVDFTEKLIERIEAEKELKIFVRRQFKRAFALVLVLVIGISFLVYQYLNPTVVIPDVELNISKTPIFILFTLFAFLGLHQVVMLKGSFAHRS